MNTPCPKVLDCPECPGTAAIANKSSEAPDPFEFLALRFYSRNPPLNSRNDWYNPEPNPRVGDCENPISQQAADDCALEDAQDSPPQPKPPPSRFLNETQSCTVPCHGGPAYVYTVPAGTFEGRTQAEANILAASYCQSRGFVSRQCPPSAVTLPATDITSSGATLNGSVNPNGEDTTVQFEYGLTVAYGSVTAPVTIPAGMSDVAIAYPVTGLSPGTYHYRILASNGMGLAVGGDVTFEIAANVIPQEWWPFEEAGNSNRIGAVANTALISQSAPAPMARVAGKVDFAVKLQGGGPFDCIVTTAGPQNTIEHIGTGFAFMFWFQANILGESGDIVIEYEVNGDIFTLHWNDSNAEWEYSGPTSLNTYPFSPGDGEWHFIYVSFNDDDGSMRMSIDNANLQDSGPQPDLIQTGDAEIRITVETNNAANLAIDEFAVFQHVPTPEEIDFVYNGGNGRTYPF